MAFERSLNKRTIILIMVFFGYALNWIFRQVVHSCDLLLYDDIESESAKSAINSAKLKFFYGLFVFQIPLGRIAERFGGKTMIGIGLLITSVLTLFMPFAVKVGGYESLIFINFFIGVSLSPFIPGIFSLSAKWIPVEERGRLVAVHASTQLGASLSLALQFRNVLSTEVIFIIPGCLGIIWTLCWYILVYDSPLTHPSISREEKHFIVHKKESQGTCYDFFDCPWFDILFDSHVWLICTVHICLWFATNFNTIKSEVFLKEMFDLTPLDNTIMISPFYIGFATLFVSGSLMDFLYSKNVPLTVMQKTWTFISTFIPGFALVGFISYPDNIELTLFFYVLGITFSFWFLGGYYMRFLDIAPNFAATLSGINNTIANIGLVMIQEVMNSMDSNTTDKQQLWDNRLSFVSALFLTAGTLYVIFGDNYIAEWNVPHTYDAV